jgi:hypothetical protein
VRNYQKGVDRYHAPQARVMTGDRSEDSPKLLSGRVEAPRDVPIAGKEDIRDITLADTEIATAAKSVADSSTGSPKGSNG